MRIKERLNKLEEKAGKKSKWENPLIAHLKPVYQGGKKVFTVIIDNEEIGVFPSEEEAKKVINEMAGEERMAVIVELVSNDLG